MVAPAIIAIAKAIQGARIASLLGGKASPPTGGGTVTPFPLKGTVTVASSGSFDGILSAADLAPVDVGLNTT